MNFNKFNKSTCIIILRRLCISKCL